MADNNEDLELDEQLEDSDADAGDDTADDESSSDESDRPKNRWASLRDGGIASRFDNEEGDDAASDEDDDVDTDTDENEEGDVDDEESDQDEDAEETDEEEGEEDDEKGKSKEKPNAARGSRYEIVDANGQKFAFSLDEGTKIRLKADGSVHEFSDMDSLIAAAQKGIHADRALSQSGQERSALSRQLQQLEKDAEADEDFLIELVTDPAWKELTDKLKAAGVQLPEKFRKVQQALGRFADPEFRKGQKAIRDQESATKRQQSEAVNTFWSAVDQQITRAIGAKGFELVDVEDKPEIVQRFYGLYEAELAKLEQQYGTSAEGKARAQREAAKVLDEKNLRRVMKVVHDRYAKRLPPGSKLTAKNGKAKGSNGGKRSADTDEQAGKREAARHNDRTKQKLQQRDGSRSLRGGGAAAGNGPRRQPQKPKTFEGRMQSAMSRLRDLGKND